MFEERQPPKSFPCSLKIKGEHITMHSREHYDYLNDKANKLYQTIYGYRSQPDFDYFCSNHPQESNCFFVALVMDKWVHEHDFNQE